MTNRTIGLDQRVHDYLLDVSLRESEAGRRLREATARLASANMQIAPEQGQFMALLARLTGARSYLEVGTYTGYSALVIAEAMGRDGRVVTLDISEEWTHLAREFWQEAGLADRITLELAPAAQTLTRLLDQGQAELFDLAFIDADKSGYVDYYEACLQLIRPGGLILVDNTLWDGSVADPANSEADTEAIRAFNRHVRQDDRIDLSLVPIGDGLTMAHKRV